MAKLTWLGEDALHPDDDRGGPRHTTWRGVAFTKDEPVEVTDPTMIAKAKGNAYFSVEDGEEPRKSKKVTTERAMLATRTRADLVNHALGNLMVLAAGQTPAAEDFDTVDEHIDPLFAELEAREIVVVDDPDAIPVEWFLPLAVLLADEAASHFGMVGVPARGGEDPVLAAITRLREVLYSRPTGERQVTEYF